MEYADLWAAANVRSFPYLRLNHREGRQMGQAIDKDGNVLGEATGESKAAVFDELQKRHPDADEIRVRTMHTALAFTGLVPGRIVYLVLSSIMADEINRRRTTGESIRDRMDATPSWPAGAQAHIGNPVYAGQRVPSMVVVVSDLAGVVNVKANLDGTDQYWARGVPYSADKQSGTWHWMYEGQQTRGNAT